MSKELDGYLEPISQKLFTTLMSQHHPSLYSVMEVDEYSSKKSRVRKYYILYGPLSCANSNTNINKG